jgi:hypothetical protein
MANQNLSQFTEKTFVADADWVFVWDTVGAISKKVSRNSLLNSGTITTDAPVTISQTWAGTGSTPFTALKVNAATTTESISTAKIVELQHNSLNRFSVQKDGVSTIGASDTAVPEVVLNLVNQYGTYGFRASNGRLGFMYNNNEVASIFNSGVIQATVFSVAGVQIARDADHTLALRNGAAAQTFRVYNTYSDTNNYRRLEISSSGSEMRILSQGTGTGSPATFNLGIGNSPNWQITTSGHFIGYTDNSYDIGASGANRPRNVYVGSNVISRPSASITPANNSELVVEATSNTTLTFKLKGTDGTVRTATLTLA